MFHELGKGLAPSRSPRPLLLLLLLVLSLMLLLLLLLLLRAGVWFAADLRDHLSLGRRRQRRNGQECLDLSALYSYTIYYNKILYDAMLYYMYIYIYIHILLFIIIIVIYLEGALCRQCRCDHAGPFAVLQRVMRVESAVFARPICYGQFLGRNFPF